MIFLETKQHGFVYLDCTFRLFCEDYGDLKVILYPNEGYREFNLATEGDYRGAFSNCGYEDAIVDRMAREQGKKDLEAILMLVTIGLAQMVTDRRLGIVRREQWLNKGA